MKPTVWIVNEAGHDYSGAEKHGQLRRLTLGDINPLQLDRLAYHLSRGIGKFTKKDDFILISGTPTVNAVALTMWLQMHKKAKVLQWNAKKSVYELSTITLDNLKRLLQRQVADG